MSADELDEVAANIDDAQTDVDELEDTDGDAAPEKLDELKDTLTRTADIIDDITDTKETD